MGRIFILIALFFALVGVPMHAQTQVQTGMYPFGPSESYGFDTINPANLNVTLQIPIITKPGRGGTNFTYSLQYDSSIWSLSGEEGSSLLVAVGKLGMGNHYPSGSRLCKLFAINGVLFDSPTRTQRNIFHILRLHLPRFSWQSIPARGCSDTAQWM